MEAECKELMRYARPTKFDQATFGTLWRILDEVDTYTETYVQVSKKDTESHWMTIQDVLGKAFQEFIHDPEFMHECLRLYSYNSERPLLTISTLIKKKEKEFIE